MKSSLKKFALESLEKLYPFSASHVGFQHKKGSLTIQRVRIAQKALLKIMGILRPLMEAAQGSIFDKIPFTIYASLLYVFTKADGVHNISWWFDKGNRKAFRGVC